MKSHLTIGTSGGGCHARSPSTLSDRRCSARQAFQLTSYRSDRNCVGINVRQVRQRVGD